MDIRQELIDAGFYRVIAVDAKACGAAEGGTLLLALWRYVAERQPKETEAWVAPYYDASQTAYLAAKAVVEKANAQGFAAQQRPDIRVKPIFARLPGFSQGRNTISYVEGIGSRFHVQTLLTEEYITPDLLLEEAAHPLHCGDCRHCMEACPAGAIDDDGYHRERCLRNWMLSPTPVPEELRPLMKNMLVGCDLCQRSCPHNPPAEGDAGETVSLMALLTGDEDAFEGYKARVGVNFAFPNRVLGQACLLAGNSGDASYLPALQKLTEHPSPVVREHAAWAVTQLTAE